MRRLVQPPESAEADRLQPARQSGRELLSLHLIVDSTGLKLRGAGEWFQDKHGSGGKRRSWLKLHIGMDAESGKESLLCHPTD
jgi:hypothetical protein